MDLPSIDKLLTTTRLVRKRLDLTRSVEPEVIQQCLDIATRAPAGGGICRYYFIVVIDPAKRQVLADLYRPMIVTPRNRHSIPWKSHLVQARAECHRLAYHTFSGDNAWSFGMRCHLS